MAPTAATLSPSSRPRPQPRSPAAATTSTTTLSPRTRANRMPPPTTAAMPDKLRNVFANMPHTDNPAIWQALYSESYTPWDRAGPSLALADLLAQRTDLIPPSQDRDPRGNPLRDPSGRVIRKSALVPGCGPGYDVLLLASLGYDTVGLDFTDLALTRARENERAAVEMRRSKTDRVRSDGNNRGNDNDDDEDEDDEDDDGVEKGTVTWLSGDFFDDDWKPVHDGQEPEKGSKSAAAPSPAPRQYDLIFDYTFLCALQPPLRPRWAKRMSQLLAPGGHLICLEFPIGKPLSQQGPPWGVWPEVYEALLAAPGQDVAYNDDGTLASSACPDAPHPDALHRICLVKPRRTHQAGLNEDGTVRDFISVWCR